MHRTVDENELLCVVDDPSNQHIPGLYVSYTDSSLMRLLSKIKRNRKIARLRIKNARLFLCLTRNFHCRLWLARLELIWDNLFLQSPVLTGKKSSKS